MYEDMAKLGTGISRTYFTKEFSGFEIESKWTLLTQNPVPVLLRMQSDILGGWWRNFGVAVDMGRLPIGIRFFELVFQFWGVERNGLLEQIAMVACMQDEDRYQLAFKGSQHQIIHSSTILCNPPMFRHDSRTGNWLY